MTFCRTFDKLFMFGVAAPLVLTDIDTPWKDIVDRWNSTTYASGAIVAGPWQTTALRDRRWGHGDGYHRHRTRVDHRIGHPG